MAPAQNGILTPPGPHSVPPVGRMPASPILHARPPEVELLRRCAWEVGEAKPATGYHPPEPHVGLAVVCPGQGFAHWRIPDAWIERTAHDRGTAWRDCRLILRLYDISYIEFNGLNAHHIQDCGLPSACGHLFFKQPRLGTWQLAEVGFVLRDGEFIPAARSRGVAFPPDRPTSQGGQAALLIRPGKTVEPIDNVWEQDRILAERRRPQLRHPLRLAAFSLASLASGQDGTLARFVTELAAGQCAQGHEVHVFVPASDALSTDRLVDGVHYHPLSIANGTDATTMANWFGRAAAARLGEVGPFDLLHLHEWTTATGPHIGSGPAVLSLGSTEATRRNGNASGPESAAIEDAEREAAQKANRVLTPAWLRERAVTELGLESDRVAAFPMEGRIANEWECPLDCGQVKMEIGVGPLDRLILFVGPLDHAAGVDLLLEALPVLLHRWGNLRLGVVGEGHQSGGLQHRADQLGISHAVRLLGHVEGGHLTKVLRSAEALVLPSRCRVPMDDAVVDLARRAGRPVVTTHGGPAHLVRHEETGIITYDNPGSMVWAVDRILGDSAHAERMGQNGRRTEAGAIVWADVARHYLELCAGWFPELTETRW